MEPETPRTGAEREVEPGRTRRANRGGLEPRDELPAARLFEILSNLIPRSPVRRLLSWFLTETTQKRIVVAIDGPAGTGKSTIAKGLAARLGFTYIDTGAMYRAVALWGVRQEVDPGDMHRMEQLAIAAGIELSPGHIALNGEDVTDAIRTPEVSSGASKIAVIPGVRRAMVAKQREIGERSSVVMEGRDIGAD